ncbi:MAG TPA: winged helix DNA-binding domain-containing protein [Kofleriaceae bacterium]|nr:winged helix DNA-binding domain-containing protein [Kofleriaceae bacterium]
MDARALNRATLARQLLLERAAIPVLAAIERVAGLQAQLARPPFVGLWTRVAGFRRDQLATLVRDKQVVRATLMRGTLHLASARDYLAWRPALQSMLAANASAIFKQRAKGIDPAAVCAYARTQLPATFDALRPLLAKRFAGCDERALGYTVRTHLPLVQLPTDDRWAYPAAAAFADAATWLGTPIAATASAHDLIRRYLAAFGPATVRDAQIWSGVPKLEPVFADLRDELVTFRDGKRELFDLPDAPRPPADTPVPVRLLPDFDNLVLAHDDRRRIVADEHRAQLTTKNLQVKATFLVDGFVAGTWTIERAKARATLVLVPFGKLGKPVRAALEAEADALVRFVEADATSYAIAFRTDPTATARAPRGRSTTPASRRRTAPRRGP